MAAKVRRRDISAVSMALNPQPRRTDRLEAKESRRPILMRARILVSTSRAQSENATHDRRQAGVMAYVGPNGGGKTLCAVQDMIPALVAGKPCWSNTPLIDPRKVLRNGEISGEPFDSYFQIKHADQLLEIDGGAEVLLDEIASVANSRESQRLDPRFQIAFHQLRKRGAAVRYTAPDLKRADVIFREVTQTVTECRGMYADRGVKDQWGLPDVWAPKRLFRRETYDFVEFDGWTSGKREAAKPEVREWCYPQKLAIDPRLAYKTLQGVDKIAGVVVDGNCAHCGKRAKTEYCKGHTDEELIELEMAELVASPVRHGRRSALLDTTAVDAEEMAS